LVYKFKNQQLAFFSDFEKSGRNSNFQKELIYDNKKMIIKFID